MSEGVGSVQVCLVVIGGLDRIVSAQVTTQTIPSSAMRKCIIMLCILVDDQFLVVRGHKL